MHSQSTRRQPIVPVGPSIAYLPLTRNLYALISVEDIAKVIASTWCAAPNSRGAFVAVCRVKKKNLLLHRILCATERGKTVDHITPGNPLNCLPHNLRPATQAEQNANRRKRKNARSVYKGVTAHTGGRCRAKINVNGRSVHLGIFASEEAASEAYTIKAKEVYGEFARTGKA